VGRAKVDVVLSKPADPGMNCSGSCAGCGLPAGVKDQMIAEFAAKMTGYNVASSLGKQIVGFPSGYSYPSELTGCNMGALRISSARTVSCPAGCVYGSINEPSVSQPSAPCTGCVDPRAWWRDNRIQPALTALRASWLAAPTKILITVGSKQCEFWVFGAWTGSYPDACWKTGDYNGVCFPVTNVYQVGVNWLDILYGIRCSNDPCAMGDHNWPLELECVCTGEYERPNVSQTPICNLFLENTSREYSNDKCLFKATYLGALGSGLIDCDATPEADDCKCCGEGGP
jgi:hypothetical protein